MSLWLVIAGKYLDVTETELETDKVRIWGCCETLRKVTSLRVTQGKVMLTSET